MPRPIKATWDWIGAYVVAVRKRLWFIFLLGVLLGLWLGIFTVAMKIHPCSAFIQDGHLHVCYLSK